MEQQVEPCIHHWRLEEPDGQMANGVCKKCGVSREHYNCIDDIPQRAHRKSFKVFPRSPLAQRPPGVS